VKPREILDTWKHNWYGIWQEEKMPECPRVEDCVVISPKPEDFELILRYLSEAKTVAVFGAKEKCFLCEELLPIGYKSDGVLLWPLDLVHYIENHAVGIPVRFSDHIRSNRYVVPDFLRANSELPWPIGKRLQNENG
jgi:hypothetical protein